MELHLVSGAPRSGTTVLQAVLSHARDTAPLLGECPFVSQLLDFSTEVASSWEDDARYYFETAVEAVQIARDAVQAIFEPLAVRHHSTAVVAKSPRLALRAPAISVVLPNAHCYAILRDVRDVIALQIKACIRELEMGFAPSLLGDDITTRKGQADVFLGREVIDVLIDRFNEYYNQTVLTTWELVSYEALVTRPHEMIERLRDVSGLDLTFRPDECWTHVEFEYLRSARNAEGAWRSDLWGRPIDASRIGAHASYLTADQVQRIEQRCSAYIDIWRSLSRLHHYVLQGDDDG